MHVLILGSGKIGSAIAKLLFHAGHYKLSLGSRNADVLSKLKMKTPFKTIRVDVQKDLLVPLFREFDLVISALSYYQNIKVAKSALDAGISYFDLTEDIQTTKEIIKISKKAKKGQVFMPQCGLAPGFIGVLGYSLSRQFEKVRSIKMRVGALPLYPTNQ